MWQPGIVVNNLLRDINHYPAATPNFWAPLQATIDQPSEQSPKPPSILKPSNRSATSSPSKAVHWKDKMREKRSNRKQAAKLVMQRQRANLQDLLQRTFHQNAMHQVRHMNGKPCKNVPIEILELPISVSYTHLRAHET